MKGNAIGIASAALNSLSKTSDSLSNRSMRDMFRSEESCSKTGIGKLRGIRRSCVRFRVQSAGTSIRWNISFAKNARRPIYANHRTSGGPAQSVWTVTPDLYFHSGIIVGAAAIGMIFSGFVAFLMLVAVLVGAGFAIKKLFSPPTPY